MLRRSLVENEHEYPAVVVREYETTDRKKWLAVGIIVVAGMTMYKNNRENKKTYKMFCFKGFDSL